MPDESTKNESISLITHHEEISLQNIVIMIHRHATDEATNTQPRIEQPGMAKSSVVFTDSVTARLLTREVHIRNLLSQQLTNQASRIASHQSPERQIKHLCPHQSS